MGEWWKWGFGEAMAASLGEKELQGCHVVRSVREREDRGFCEGLFTGEKLSAVSAELRQEAYARPDSSV
jgi:hypothetical protein